MESQPQNPEIRNNPENFHPYKYILKGHRYNLHCIQLRHTNADIKVDLLALVLGYGPLLPFGSRS